MNKPEVGDFFVVHTTGIAARLIQLGTRSKWNHAGIYLGDDLIIEARPSGVKKANISKYDGKPILWYKNPDMTPYQRVTIQTFTERFENDGYGIWSIIALGFKCLTFGIPFLPANWMAEREKRVICSQLVAWCYSHAGIKLTHKRHALVTPKDLAKVVSGK